MDTEEYVEAVLRVVEQVPRGRVTTYGGIAEVVGVGGPRQVGRVMATYGGPVPWWRVVRADGSLPECHERSARTYYTDEATPMRPSGRIDMPRALWWPADDLDEELAEGRPGPVGQV